MRALAGEAERLLDDASPLVRGAAVWALGRLDAARLRQSRARVVRARPTRPCRASGLWRTQRRCPTCSASGSAIRPRIYIAEFGGEFDRIAGTVRTREKAAAIAAAGIGGHTVEAFVFDGAKPRRR